MELFNGWRKIMSQSSRYSSLKTRLLNLEEHYVAELYEKSNLGLLDEKEQDLCRGYRVLCHAEIESYSEDRARELLSTASREWKESKRVTKSLLCLFAYFKFIENNKFTLDTKVSRVCSDFEKEKIKANHGLKESNLKSIFVPLGIDFTELDQTWLNTMNSYGSSRGETAHTSYKTQAPIDLNSEKDTIDKIMVGLRELDLKISQLLI